MLDVGVSSGSVDPSADLIKAEILRVGAAPAEMRSARAIVAAKRHYDPRAYGRLTPRMRRLVDLLIVAGDQIELAPADEMIPSPADA